MRSLAWIAAVALGALAGAGCGNVTPSPDEQVRGAFESFVESCAGDEPQSAAEILTEPSRKPFIDAPDTLTACRRVLGSKQPSPAGTPDSLRGTQVVSVDERGGVARAQVRLPTGEVGEAEAEQISGQWRLVLR